MAKNQGLSSCGGEREYMLGDNCQSLGHGPGPFLLFCPSKAKLGSVHYCILKAPSRTNKCNKSVHIQ